MATAESGGGEPRIGSAGATPGVHRVHRSGSSSVLEFLGAVSHFQHNVQVWSLKQLFSISFLKIDCELLASVAKVA